MIKIPLKLLKLIKENKNFLIVSHINPEADAIGSSIAFALALKKIGKYVYILNKDRVPDIYKFLPYSKLITRKAPSKEFDIMFVLDCANFERTGLKNLKAKKIVIIDHHIPVSQTAYKPFASFIDTGASATGELIYRLLCALCIPIDKDIAVNLYASIYTDTGGFRYSNTNPESLKISAKLLKAGADPWEIAKEVYENLPLRYFKLLAKSLLTLEKQGRTAWITITKNMYKKTNTSVQDTENIVDFPRKIQGVEVAVLFREDKKNAFKISLRSKGKINVAAIASSFGGGGHANAAGCKINGTLPEVKKKILRSVKKAIKAQNAKLRNFSN